MHIARAVLHSQHVRGLRQVRHNRVVARYLPLVRVVPAECPLYSQPRRNHHTIDIHRHRAQAQAGDDMRDHSGIERLQPFDRLHRESREPPTHGASRRKHLHPTKAQEDGIVRHIADVVQASTADHEQPDQQAHHRDYAEVAAQARALERSPDPIIETHRAQIPIKQLHSGIRRQLDIAELQRKISLDTSPQIGFSYPHYQWPFVCGLKVCSQLLSTTTEGLFQST